MMKRIDLETWNRKEHFHFFSTFDEPFFSLVSEIDCSQAYEKSKTGKPSFFARYLHASIRTVNEIPEFKFRIHEDRVVQFDTINASPTLGRADGTFGFGFIPYTEDLQDFAIALAADSERVSNSSGLGVNANSTRQDVVHYSSIPWINFTALTHARDFKFKDSAPKITFGKASRKDQGLMLPVSVTVHHGFVDGFHVGQFFERFQELMDG